VSAKQREQSGANILKIDPAVDFARDFVQATRAGRHCQMMKCLFHVGLDGGKTRLFNTMRARLSDSLPAWWRADGRTILSA
jgi:hypothetical protein